MSQATLPPVEDTRQRLTRLRMLILRRVARVGRDETLADRKLRTQPIVGRTEGDVGTVGGARRIQGSIPIGDSSIVDLNRAA